jgi:hypothetical protein
MGKRPKKKIFLFLVEGVSDRNALEVPFGQLLEDIDPDIVLEFAMLMQDDGSFGGDITSKNGKFQNNIRIYILKKLSKWHLKSIPVRHSLDKEQEDLLLRSFPHDPYLPF